MTKKLVSILIILVVVVYLVLGFILPDYWEKQYLSESFGLRTEKNFPELNSSFELDTSYSESNKYYYQSWKLKSNKEAIHTFHVQKEIYYTKSFWLWQNQYTGETNSYLIPISKEKIMELSYHYNFDTDSSTIHQQMHYTEFGEENKRKNDSLAFAYAEENDLYLCGTTMMDQEMFDFKEISLSEFDSIITYWSNAGPK